MRSASCPIARLLLGVAPVGVGLRFGLMVMAVGCVGGILTFST